MGWLSLDKFNVRYSVWWEVEASYYFVWWPKKYERKDRASNREWPHKNQQRQPASSSEQNRRTWYRRDDGEKAWVSRDKWV